MTGATGPAPGDAADPAAEADRLYQALRAAMVANPPPDAARRRADLARLATVLRANRPAITAAIAEDFGHRALAETELLELLPALNAISHARRHLAGWMRPQRRRVSWLFQPARARVHYQPLGVVGIIAPWNYPLLLAVSPLVDALTAGNRVLIKPSELTPAWSDLLRRLLAEGFPADQVVVLTGGAAAAAAVARLPLDHLLFTGSTAIGREVARAAAERLTPVTLELGGKSPALVCADYPLARAARSIVLGKFVNAGQTCIAPDYVLAPAAAVPELADRLLTEIRAAYPVIAGNADYTSIINDRHYRRLADAVAVAEAAGATIRRHGDAGPTDGSRRFPPTLVIDPPADSPLMREEIFGPVLPILGYDRLDDAIARINHGDRPLALYCFSHDRASRARVLHQTLSGGVTLNGTLLHCAQDDLPFGGIGASGQGAYHGQDGFRRFSHARAVHQVGPVNGFEWLRPPYGRLSRWARHWLLKRPG